MIKNFGNKFYISTDSTTYMFGITEEGLPEHYYYGSYIPFPEKYEDDFFRAVSEKVSHGKGTTVNYRKDSLTVMEDMLLEISSLGKGDYRDPFVIVRYENGSDTSDFIYEGYEISNECKGPELMPGAYGGSQSLTVSFKERDNNLVLKIIYTVYPECNVITRRSSVINESDADVAVKRLMSMQLDLDEDGLVFNTFNGRWAREMNMTKTPVNETLLVNRSLCGASSNRANPFVMLGKNADERHGDVYGFNLIYSGNHYESVQKSGFGKIRFLSGIDDTCFEWNLKAGDCFEAPEAIMTFSECGYEGISRAMHRFIRNHIVRGTHKDSVRPVLLNSWEACYFDISESKLVNLAAKAAKAGVELFVVDDGWFKGRNSDTSSLGDWVCDEKKLPGGLSRLSRKIKELGLQFGIWVEPEMINEDSDLYREHPEYAMAVPGKQPSVGRNQLILDLCNPKVREYVKNAMEKVFEESAADYVKWDMNRLFSDAYSAAIGGDRQGEVYHRYILGLYEIMKYLTERFPNILFEGCASGGNRFDPGMLAYMPQIWASDDTDARERFYIQSGYSYGYPMNVLTSHVSSCPNHQTLRNTPLYTRFNVALFGNLGYELNLCELSSEEFAEVKEQIALYKQWRVVTQKGDFKRVNDTTWVSVSSDKKKAVAMIFNELAKPNDFYLRLELTGLDPEKYYHIYNVPMKHNIIQFGDLVNMVAPIHIRKDSLVQKTVSKFVKMDGEKEDYFVSGALLNKNGIKLSQAFGGTGYNDETRLFQDFSSRLYFIEEAD